MIRDLCGLTRGLPRPIRTTSVGLWKQVDLWCGDLRGQWHNASSGAGWNHGVFKQCSRIMLHSSDQEILEVIEHGDAFLSGLESEIWRCFAADGS